jgi:hypothetical protein
MAHLVDILSEIVHPTTGWTSVGPLGLTHGSVMCVSNGVLVKSWRFLRVRSRI